MSKNIDFIIFAIQQAKKAEKFGFTRNECCRNLKTALHQYWQNKTMGLHGQSQKKNIPRSRDTSTLPLSECIVEHVVPQMVIVNMLMDLDSLKNQRIEKILRKYFRVFLVSKNEDALLRKNRLGSTMPDDWDGQNIYQANLAHCMQPGHELKARSKLAIQLLAILTSHTRHFTVQYTYIKARLYSHEISSCKMAFSRL